jgi:hypothetical protein
MPELCRKNTFFLSRQFSCWVLALIPFVYLVFVVVKYSVDVPFWDQWELVPLLEKSYQGTLSFHDLWAQHALHRLFFPKLIMIVLARFSRWKIFYELALNIVLATGIFLAIIYQVRTTAKSISCRGIHWLIPIISFMVFSLNQVGGWLHGWQLQIFLNVFPVVIGIVLLGHPAFRWWRFTLALLFGIVASYSYANGFIYWLIGLGILFFVPLNNKRTMRLSVTLWVVASSITSYLYLYDYRIPRHVTSLWINFEQLLDYTSYVLTYLGAPLLTFSNRLQELPIINKVAFCNEGAAVVGLLGLIVSCYTVSLLIRRQHIKFQALVPYVSLSLYSIGSALLTAMGRGALGSDQALSSRYLTIANLFWISNVVFLYLLVNSKKPRVNTHRENRLRKYALVSISVIVVLIALSSAHRTVSAINNYEYLLAGRNELLSVKEEELYEPLRPLYPSADIVKERVTILKRYGLSLFRNRGSYHVPRIMNAKVEPETVLCDGSGSTLITASVLDPDGDFGVSSSIVVDLPWQILRNQKMYDDGTHGDIAPGDRVYSYLATVPEGIADSPKTVVITATDDANSTGIGWVKLGVIDPDAIYVDDSDAELVCDDWAYRSGFSLASGAYEDDFFYHKPGDGFCTATWRPDIPQAGNYDVYAWWTTGYLNRATNAKFTINCHEGSYTTKVSQMKNGSRWNYLGTYYFAAGTSGYVVLSNDADNCVLADAVKFIMNSGEDE